MSDRPEDRDQADADLDYLDATLPDHGDDVSAVPPVRDRPVPVDAQTTAAIPPPPASPVAATGTPVAADDRTWFWPIANLIGLIVVIAVNYLANWLELNGQSTGDVVNQDPVPFQPAGWVFSIWGLIYLLLATFVIYGLLPAGRHNARLQRLSPFFLIANLANICWIVLWHYEQFFASLVLILVLLVSLLAIYVVLRARNPLRRSVPVEQPTIIQRLVLWLPFSVYLGWVCVAALANLMVWLDRSGWDGGPFSYNLWAVIFMLGGTAIAAAFAWIARDPIIPLVMMVAFTGIASHAWGESALVTTFGILFAVVQAALAAMAWVMSSADARPAPEFGQNTPATM